MLVISCESSINPMVWIYSLNLKTTYSVWHITSTPVTYSHMGILNGKDIQ